MSSTNSNSPGQYTHNGLWLLGRHLQCTITPVDINPSTGAIYTVANQFNTPLHLLLERAAIRVRRQLEDIAPTSSFFESNVPLKFGATVELTQILHSEASNGSANTGVRNQLAWVAMNGYGGYAKVVMTRAYLSWAFYGTTESYEERYERGKNLGVLTLSVISTGSQNPYYGR